MKLNKILSCMMVVLFCLLCACQNINKETTVKPAYSVICDSKKNPAEDKTVSILEYVGSKVYSTRDGDVYVSSDGKEIKIIQQTNFGEAVGLLFEKNMV